MNDIVPNLDQDKNVILLFYSSLSLSLSLMCWGRQCLSLSRRSCYYLLQQLLYGFFFLVTVGWIGIGCNGSLTMVGLQIQ